MKIARLVATSDDIGDVDFALISPAMAGLPQGYESIFATLPIHNINGWLDDIGELESNHCPGCTPAVFAADPFLDAERVLQRFRRAGFGELAIWPSVGIFGGTPDLSSEGLDFARETEFAHMASAAGFAVTATIFNVSQARSMIDAGVRRFVLHPPLVRESTAGGDDADNALAQWLQSLFPDGRPQGVQTYLFSSHGDGHQGESKLVDGILICRTGRSSARHVTAARRNRRPAKLAALPSRLPFLARRRGAIVVGASIGSGAAAHAVANGGADFIVALNAGRFRMMGTSSSACYLPLRDTNNFVDGFAREEILPRVRVPVFLGVYAGDPRRSIDDIIATTVARGYQGITNFPTIARYSGPYRKRLEASGFGIHREYELLTRAKQAGLATLAYARDPDEAAHFAALRADILCLQFGSAAGRLALPSETEIEDIAGKAGAMIRRIRKHNATILCLLAGGAILSPQTMMRVCDLAKADGYVGGSTFDKFPAVTSIEDRTAEFKAAVQFRYGIEGIEKQIRLYRRFGLVTTESDHATVHERVKRLAASSGPIVISGARGTGKSLLARLIHSMGPARNHSVESLSLGAAEGYSPSSALAGVISDAGDRPRTRLGWFQLLSGQDLVLENLERADRAVQTLLLEAIETRQFRPVGAMASLPFDVRLIITSREPLAALRAAGKLDDDLYLQLRPSEIELHSLRERPEDIPLIVDFLLEDIGRRAALGIEHAAIRALQTCDWPGNIRELRSFLEEVAVLAEERKITLEDLDMVRRNRDVYIEHPKEMTEREWLLDALRRHSFHRTEAAAFLGISRKTLYNKMKRLRLLQEH
jgi:predicted TIM-barrel enzyme/DNA-binding NtrC family response regulator